MSDGEAYKRLMAEHTQLQAQHRTLQQLLHLFAAPEDFQLVFNGVMDAAMEVFSAHSGALYMFDSDHDELYFAAARGPKAEEVLELDVTIKPGEGLAGSCFQDQEVIAVSDVHKDARFSEQVSEAVGYDVQSMLTVPIVCDGASLGVIQVLNKKTGSTFSASEVKFASRFGRYVGGLIGLGLELQELSGQPSGLGKVEA